MPKDWNVRGVMTSDVHSHDRRMGGRRSPRELTTQFYSRVGTEIEPIRFDFDMISTGEKKVGGKSLRVTCQNTDCDHRYGNDTSTKVCPKCNTARQGADTRKLRVNVEVPSKGLDSWSLWLDAKRQHPMRKAIEYTPVELTDNPEFDVANIAADLVGIVPDIHIFGYNLRTLIAKDLWMKAFYEQRPDKKATKIQFSHVPWDAGIEEDDPAYDEFDDNEDDYKERWF